MKFIDQFNRIAADMESGNLLNTHGEKYRPYASYYYRIVISWFEKFNSSLESDEISVQVLNDFMLFLMNNDLSKNYIKNIMIRLKYVIGIINYREGIQTDLSKVRFSGEKSTSIYNSISDIDKLLNLDLSDCPGQERLRDAYVIHCFTGLRFGDFKRLMINPEYYIKTDQGKYFFVINTQKTTEVVVIPLSSRISDLLKRRGSFGKLFSNKYYNSELKNIGKKAGVDDFIIKVITKGGERVETPMRKYDLMSSHTARRSFATNAYLAGIPALQIMKITGHQTEQSFMLYIKAGGIENALSLADHPFFK